MKKLLIIIALCLPAWVASAAPGGTRIKTIVDLGKGLNKVTWYYENGNVAEEGFYLQGKKHGTWTSFDESGNKNGVANWNRDKKEGDCYVMHPNGQIKYHLVYSDNKKVKAAEWDENGTLIAGNTK